MTSRSPRTRTAGDRVGLKALAAFVKDFAGFVRRHLFLCLACGVVSSGIVFAYGAAVGRYEVFPYSLIAASHQGIRSGYGMITPLSPGSTPAPRPRLYRTIEKSDFRHQSLVLNRILVRGDPGHPFWDVSNGPMKGGGVTDFGGDVLILEGQGRMIRLALRDQDVQLEEVPFAAPDNGLDALREYFRAHGSKPASKPEVEPIRLRYEGILAVPRKTGVTEVFVAYSAWDSENRCYQSRVAKKSVSSLGDLADGADWKVIYRSKPCLQLVLEERLPLIWWQGGNRLDLFDEHHLVVTIGDYAHDGITRPDPLPARRDNDYGKTILLNTETGEYRLISMGHRNHQGIVVTKEGVFTTEHGPQGGEELNLISRERIQRREIPNFGWPAESYGVDYNTTSWPFSLHQQRHSRFEKPVFAFIPSVGLSNITYVKGFHPDWDGSLLLASLKDASLYRTIYEGGKVRFMERIPIGYRIRYVHQSGNGAIVMFHDDQAALTILQKSAFVTVEAPPVPELSSCLVCHSGAGAPSLYRIFGRKAGTQPGVNYSNALRTSSFAWTERRLQDYIRNPQEIVPGTTMPAQQVGEEGLAAIIEWLKANTKEAGRGGSDPIIDWQKANTKEARP
jgi:cytochrome c2